MEELLKILDIEKINFIHLDYTDKNGNFKTLNLDYRKEYSEMVNREENKER